MKVPFVDLERGYEEISEEVNLKIRDVLRKQHFVLGTEVENFEGEFANYLGIKHAVGVGSGTDGLIISLKVLGIGKGDEVIVPVNSFIATAIAVTEVGAVPVFVDADKDTYQLDLEEVKKKLTRRTKAIIPVHLYGSSCDMSALVELAKRSKLLVIEDACQAHGAMYLNKKLGTFGDLGVFSFYPSKNLGAYGDGGAICTNDHNLCEKIKKIRNYGETRKYYHDELGVNSRLDEIQAAILRVKLRHLDDWNKKRRRLAELYKKILINVKTQKIERDAMSNYYIFAIEVECRNILMTNLSQRGVQTLIHYPVPIHLQKCYNYLGYKEGDFPVAEMLSKNILSLPMFPHLSEKEIIYVCKLINGLTKKI